MKSQLRSWLGLVAAVVTSWISIPARAQPLPEDLAAAMGMDLAAVSSSSITGDPRQYAILESLGVLVPLEADTFVLLSTGVVGAGTSSAVDPTAPGTEPGSDLGGACPNASEFDCVTLSLELVVPAGMSSLELGFVFLSTEYPEWVGTEYNDELTVSVTRPQATYANVVADADGNPMTASSPLFQVPCQLLGDTGFDLLSSLPDFICDAGATGVLTSRVPVAPGETIQVDILLRDRGDAAWDSAVLLDNLRFSDIPADDPDLEGNVHLESVDPAVGTVDGGTEVTVHGSGLVNVSAVRIGTEFEVLDEVEDFEVVDDSTLTYVAPPHPPGKVHLVVSASPSTNPSTGVLPRAYDYRFLSTRPPDDGGCSCRLHGRLPGRTGLAGALCLVAVIVLRRRRNYR